MKHGDCLHFRILHYEECGCYSIPSRTEFCFRCIYVSHPVKVSSMSEGGAHVVHLRSSDPLYCLASLCSISSWLRGNSNQTTCNTKVGLNHYVASQVFCPAPFPEAKYLWKIFVVVLKILGSYVLGYEFSYVW